MIFIDSREKAVIKELVAFVAGPAKVLSLECADFVLFDRDGHSLGIERKAVSDLLGSLGKRQVGNGNVRLFDQLERMAATYSHRLLMVEGRLQFNVITKKVITGQRQSGWSHGSVQQQLWKIQSEGTSILVTDDKWASADLLRILHNKAEAGCVLPSALLALEQEEIAA